MSNNIEKQQLYFPGFVPDDSLDKENNDAEKEKSSLDELFAEVKQYRSSKHFRDLLNFFARFKSYAAYNCMLLFTQRPGVQYVLSIKEWRKKYNRLIKTDARPLIILQPFGPVMFLYDVSDTVPISAEKDTFPEELLEPYKCANKQVDTITYRNLINNLPALGIYIDEFSTGAEYAGKLECSHDSDPMLDFTINKQGQDYHFKYHCLYTIKYSSTQKDTTTRFATIIHELAHLFLHHIHCQYDKEWPQTRPELSHASQEFEAESVACLVCLRQGIDSQSYKYLAHYLDENEEIPEVSIDEIIKVVNQIEKLLFPMKIKDGLLYKLDTKFKNLYDSQG